ncbi:MAG: DUF2202 domain-containing protein [Lachnospiraceae bacterium]|nr:DUF2202 domain-containing protein [Lachnospiraceae bacterium]
MRKKTSIKFATIGMSIMTLIGTGLVVHAEGDLAGAAEAAQDKDYELEEMLQYAMEDEYLAFTEYEMILEKFGEQRPFSNIVKAEEYHISLLEPLFEEYDIAIPNEDWESLVTVPDSIEDAYAAGVTAEEANIAMYEKFLNEEIPDDAKAVFEKLLASSQRHLAAYTRFTEGSRCDNNGVCDGTGQQGTRGMGQQGKGMGAQGTGNRGAGRGSCLTIS